MCISPGPGIAAGGRPQAGIGADAPAKRRGARRDRLAEDRLLPARPCDSLVYGVKSMGCAKLGWFCNFLLFFVAASPVARPQAGWRGGPPAAAGGARGAAAAGPQARLRSSRSVWGTGMEPMPSATISRHSRFCGMIGGTGMVLGSGVASAMGFSSALPVTSPRRKKPL